MPAQDPLLARILDAGVPKLNPDIAGGLAVKQLQQCDAYVDALIRALAKGFPEGFTYVRYDPCQAQTEFDELTKKKNSAKRQYEIARSSLYMNCYIFKYKGEEIRRYISMPFVEDAGVTYLGGPRFVISPFLVDRAMSIEREGIFIPFGRGKVTFEREPCGYMADGDNEKGLFTLHGNIYNRQPNEKTSVKGKTTLVHYLFCKFGYEQTFRRFAGAVPVVGSAEEINHVTYPQSEWVICQSRGIAPGGPGAKYWKPNLMRLAVRRSDYTRDMRQYIAGFFYILDLFPNRLEPKLEVLNHTGRWRVLMGHLINAPGLGEGHLHDNVTDHIGSVDEYLDEIMRAKFATVGVHAEDIYEFFGILIHHFEEWYLAGQDKINSLYDKELNVLDHVMSDVRIAINTFYFKLVASAKSKREQGKELKKEDIVNLMNKFLRPGKIYSISKGHPEVSTTTTSGDNKAFKITSMMVPQSKASRRAPRNDAGAMNDQSKWLHVSVAEVGGYANMPKSDPSGHSRVNLYLRLTEGGVVLRNPSLAPILDPVQELIRRRT